MTWEQGFQIANSGAMFAWLALILLPRRLIVVRLLRYGAVGALAAAYVALVGLHLGGLDMAKFATLAGVRSLLNSDGAAVIGWLHYLAFDLFVGVWIAEQADQRGWPRLAQVPVLLLTFMFGPAGLLAFYLASPFGRRLTP